MAVRLINDDDEPTPQIPQNVQFGMRVSEVRLPVGLGTYDEIMDELFGYVEVFKGAKDAPVNSPYLQLMEVATAYLTRAYEIEMLIYQGEHNGDIKRGEKHYHLRTGPLASFINTARRMADLGSRRLSQEDLLTAQRRQDTI